MLSERTATNLQAGLVLVAFIALLIFVPHELLRPLSVGVVVFAVLAVFGIRACLRRLENIASLLDADAKADPALLLSLLTEPERRFFLLRSGGTAADTSRLIRRRQSVLTSIGMCIAIPGFCAFLVAIFFYSV